MTRKPKPKLEIDPLKAGFTLLLAIYGFRGAIEAGIEHLLMLKQVILRQV
jgi:hypothetical protein